MGKAEIVRTDTDIHNLNQLGFNLITSKYKERERKRDYRVEHFGNKNFIKNIIKFRISFYKICLIE